MTTAVENGQKKDDIKSLLLSDNYKRQFAMALPKHITPDRFVRVAITALTKTPGLQKCTQASLLSCLVDLSALGLEPDGRKAHLIPYGEVCTLLIDYKGLVDLARRSGQVSYIHADTVCENDIFEYAYGSNAYLKHVPASGDRGKVTRVYSFVKLKDGSEDFVVMNFTEVEEVRKRSKAATKGPWVTDWNEMAKKTVFRRHSKWLPLSSEFQEAVEKDIDTPEEITRPEQPLIAMPKSKSEVEETKVEEREPGADG